MSPRQKRQRARIDARVNPTIKRKIEEMASERRVSVNWMTEELLLYGVVCYDPNWQNAGLAQEEKAVEEYVQPHD